MRRLLLCLALVAGGCAGGQIRPDDARLLGCLAGPASAAVVSVLASLFSAAAGANVDAGHVGLDLVARYGAPLAACAVDRAWAELRTQAGELGAAGKPQPDGTVLRSRAAAPTGVLEVVRFLKHDRAWLEVAKSK